MGTKGQLENILAELGRKIDVLISETKDSTEDVREEVERKIQDLKKRKEKLENDFEKYKDDNEGKWDDAKSHANTALIELKKAVEILFKGKK